jgi:hypothetical protein
LTSATPPPKKPCEILNSRVSPRRVRPRIEPVDLAFARPCRRRNHVRSPVPRESITCLTDAYCRLRLRLVRLSVSPETRGVMYPRCAAGNLVALPLRLGERLCKCWIDWPLRVEPPRSEARAGRSGIGALQPVADDAAYE